MEKQLKDYSDDQLKKIAKHYSISGYENMSRDDLEKRINDIIGNNIDEKKYKNFKFKNSKNNSKNWKFKNTISVQFSKENLKNFLPRIILSLLLVFEFITFIQPIISHTVFDEVYSAFSPLGVKSIYWFVDSKDWVLIMSLSIMGFLWTSHIFYRLIKYNQFNYIFFISIIFGAIYFYYRVFSKMSSMIDAQNFYNANHTSSGFAANSKFKGLLDFYWSIFSLSIIFVTIPTFIVVVNFFTKTFPF